MEKGSDEGGSWLLAAQLSETDMELDSLEVKQLILFFVGVTKLAEPLEQFVNEEAIGPGSYDPSMLLYEKGHVVEFLAVVKEVADYLFFFEEGALDSWVLGGNLRQYLKVVDSGDVGKLIAETELDEPVDCI